MNDDHTLALHTKYPKVFSPQEPLECGDGWFDLLDTACYLVEARLTAEPTLIFELFQIKEKFGSLVIYYRGGDDYIRGVIEFAQSMSHKICEISGNTGSLHVTKTGWYRTVSDAVAVEREMIKCAVRQ